MTKSNLASKKSAKSLARKILIIEDDVSLIKALILALQKAGFETKDALTAEDGLLKAVKEKPDLILLDIRLPKMDGLTMLRKLREDPWGKEVPVVLLTNMNSPEHVAKATEYRAFDYLVKSDWKLEDVVNKIKQKLRME